jgi:MFS family permease
VTDIDRGGGLKPETDSPHRSRWLTPELYGAQAALTSMGSVAAPLLAGFSLAAVVQTLTLTPRDVRWRDAAFLLFMLAAVLFLGTVQATFWARQYQTTPAEIKSWWPDADSADRLARLTNEQRLHAAGFRMWTNRARITYGLALLVLIAALTTLAIPPPSHHHVAVLRWAAVAVGVVAFTIEVIWTAGSFTINRWAWAQRLLAPRPPGDADDAVGVRNSPDATDLEYR